jgi:hypothetical protein
MAACGTAGPDRPDAASVSDASSRADAEPADASDRVDGGPDACGAISGEIEGWLEAHGSCRDDDECTRLMDPHLPTTGPQCAAVAAPGDDLPALAAITARYRAAGCDDADESCPGDPGIARCVESRCELVDPLDACSACLEEGAMPVCTSTGLNAHNECAARACFGDTSAVPGFCPTPASCSDVGGTCHYVEGATGRCRDGSRHDVFDPENGCGGGHFWGGCCVPWDQPCTFFGGSSMALERDPFTCEVAPHCISGVQADACTYSATLQSSAGGSVAVDADVEIEARPLERARVTGRHRGSGRTFSCEGAVADDLGLMPTSWACEACDGDACTTCEIAHLGLCRL